MKNKYKHIFFDLDRTLWDFETNSKLALEEMFIENNIEARSVKPFDKFYKTYNAINEFYWRQYRRGDLKKESLRSIRFIRTLESIGIDDVSLGAQMGERYIELSPYKTALFPNTIEVLDYLKAEGYHMHIITNGFKEVQYIKLSESKLDSYFEQVIISEEFGTNKPHPDIFHHAFSLAKAENHESLMIGDSIEADLKGAKGVDMDQIYFNPDGFEHKNTFTFEIADLSELKTIL